MNLRQFTNDISDLGLSSEESVDKVYEYATDPRFDWDTPPTKSEFNYFLGQFATWVSGEQKKDMVGLTSPGARSKLIENIKASAAANGAGTFPGIDPLVFGTQLALRVRRPRTVDQGRTSLCGAASVLYEFVKSKPADFAQFALDLFFKGRANFGNMDVEPSARIRGNYRLRKSKIPWALDYVTLVSLRGCSFAYDIPGLKSLRGADETTLPGQLATWLRDGGYSNVEDHTFFGKNQQKAVAAFASMINQPMHLGTSTADISAKQDRMKLAKDNLQSASNALAGGKAVFFFVDGEVADALQRKRSGSLFERSDPTAMGKHHWITIRKINIVTGSAVNIKAFTWGAVYEGAFEMKSFLSRYNGYICADA